MAYSFLSTSVGLGYPKKFTFVVVFLGVLAFIFFFWERMPLQIEAPQSLSSSDRLFVQQQSQAYEDEFSRQCAQTELPRENNECMAYHPSRILMSIVPKGGATLAAQLVFRHAGFCDDNGPSPSLCKKGVTIHRDRIKLQREKDPRFSSVPCSVCQGAYSSWTCIKLVRSPLDRVVSSYLHLMKHNFSTRWTALNQTAAAAGHNGWNATFSDFVLAAREGQHFPFSNHYLPQTRTQECLESLHLLPVETIEDGVQQIANITAGKLQLNASGLTSSHYAPKAGKSYGTDLPTSDSTHLLYPGRDNLPPQNYASYLRNETLNAMICQMFCADFQVYASACSQEWVLDYPMTLQKCRNERERVTRICGPMFGDLFAY